MRTVERPTVTVYLPMPTTAQRSFLDSSAKRKVVVAGRRSGKTTGFSIIAVEGMLNGRRVLESAPTSDQTTVFWDACKSAVAPLVDAGYVYKNETERLLEMAGTGGRIRAKTAWNADTLRGDYADLLLLDEYQDMEPEAWTEVGAPMLLDNDGDAVFAGTAKRQSHLRNLFERAMNDDTGRWAAWHFTSFDNPHLSDVALSEIAGDMTSRAYRQEIMGEWLDDVEGALWKRSVFQYRNAPDLARIVVGIDPAVTAHESSDETGIIVAGKGVDGNWYILADRSCRLSPDGWARRAIAAFHEYEADRVVVEVNNGGDLVRRVMQTVDASLPITEVRASRGKAVRAEPIAALYEQGRVFHVEAFDELEDQMISWTPESGTSPDRMDALIWSLTELSQQGFVWGAV